ncbi:Hypothetical predicted protein [Mytilus galloprovincialis]|uniref:C2H2-type domain-containing protein n=1 Tax=Mytilus galloprovincialis TaxID=29158 RepID=A0A8B6EGM4_MYTGA|nr:Hypothetical predicted protein [Mytilus galloprovincialis]
MMNVKSEPVEVDDNVSETHQGEANTSCTSFDPKTIKCESIIELEEENKTKLQYRPCQQTAESNNESNTFEQDNVTFQLGGIRDGILDQMIQQQTPEQQLMIAEPESKAMGSNTENMTDLADDNKVKTSNHGDENTNDLHKQSNTQTNMLTSTLRTEVEMVIVGYTQTDSEKDSCSNKDKIQQSTTCQSCGLDTANAQNIDITVKVEVGSTACHSCGRSDNFTSLTLNPHGENFNAKKDHLRMQTDKTKDSPFTKEKNELENHDDQASLKLKHKGTHKAQKTFQCEICNKTFSQSRDFKRHNKIHAGDRPHKCETCDRTFVMSSDLKSHLRTHSGDKPHACEICKKPFARRDTLKIHMMMHKGERPYECLDCGKRFIKKASLKLHSQTHSGVKHHECELCSKFFGRSTDLKYHMRTHTGEKPYQCQVCGLQFAMPVYLKTHALKHSGETPYECKLCDKKFVKKSSLEAHNLTHTGQEPDHECETCGKKFYSESSLKKHSVIHMDEKPHQCEWCGRSFSQASTLKSHVTETHIGEKPFVCHLCGKRFARRTTLNTHGLTHSGIKSHECQMCGKGFSRKSDLRRHEKTHISGKRNKLTNSVLMHEEEDDTQG